MTITRLSKKNQFSIGSLSFSSLLIHLHHAVSPSEHLHPFLFTSYEHLCSILSDLWSMFSKTLSHSAKAHMKCTERDWKPRLHGHKQWAGDPHQWFHLPAEVHSEWGDICKLLWCCQRCVICNSYSPVGAMLLKVTHFGTSSQGLSVVAGQLTCQIFIRGIMSWEIS